MLETRSVQEVQSVFQKIIKQKYLVAVICLTILCLSLIGIYAYVKVSSLKIYPNIKVAGVHIGGLMKEEAVSKLIDNYSTNLNNQLTLKMGEKEEVVSFKELDVTYDIQGAVENSYRIGREGGFFKRFIEIISIDLKGKTVDVNISYDNKKLAEILTKLEEPITIKVKDDSYKIEEGRLYFSFGSSGKGIDRDKAIKTIEEKLKEGKGAVLSFELADIEPERLSADLIPSEPKDATFLVENYRTLKYVPEVYGVKFDKELFNRLQSENSKLKKDFSIPVESVKPTISVKDLKAKTFINTLSSYETYYGSSPDNRKHNIQIAASKISDVILAPGDEFSYNKIVGPRTPERGFQLAHAYSNGKIIDDFGGGICQVSTTLYNVVLRSELQVTARTNHMFTVSYVPAGMDAAVNYGSVDFKFKNNTKWPIKIINKTTPTTVKFEILGTNLGESKTIEFRKEVLKTIPYTIQETPDATLDEGKTVIDQKGANGCVVNVYKVIKKGGTLVSEKFLYKDSYRALTEIVKKGTKPISGTTDNSGTQTTPEDNKPSNNENSQIDLDVPNIQEPTIPTSNGQELPSQLN